MRYAAMILALAVAACSKSPTAPQAPPPPPKLQRDPTILLVNHDTMDPRDSLELTWWEQNGQTVHFVALPGDSLCTHFTPAVQGDSEKMLLRAPEWFRNDPPIVATAGGVNWVPQDSSHFTVIESATGGGSPLLGYVRDSVPPC